MLGFGKKKKAAVTEPVVPDEEIRIHSIPKTYYGAKNITPAPKPPAPVVTPTAPAKPKPTTAVPRYGTPHGHKKKWMTIGMGVVVLLAVIGGATWYYTRDLPEPTRQIPVTTPPVQITPINEIPPDTQEDPPEIVATSTPTLLSPLVQLASTIDFDSDGLTDIEEELFAADVADGDSDGDGYLDGLEVINLYDPMREAPDTIEDSNNIAKYTNPVHDYALLYPTDWLAAAVDESTKDEVFFTSLTGEYVSLTHYVLENNESFVAWFAKNNPEVVFSSLIPWQNRVGTSGWFEANRQRYYFAWSDAVLVMQYQPGVRSAINFKTTMRMMAESLYETTLAEGVVLPGEQDGVVTSTVDGVSTSTPSGVSTSTPSSPSATATSTVINTPAADIDTGNVTVSTSTATPTTTPTVADAEE